MADRKWITLRLPESFVAETLIFLDGVVEQWEATQDYLESDYCPDDVVIRECGDPEKAQQLAHNYEAIRRLIQTQYHRSISR